MDQKANEIVSILGRDKCLFVGGCVRDQIMGVNPKDIDIEVYGMDYDSIIRALEGKFSVKTVGASFGIIKVDENYDVSIPRSENKIGIGHKGFETSLNPNMSPKDAAKRRDFTMNALAMTPDGEVLDFFGGKEDIGRKILRATSEAFMEDPLRVLRAMQFAGRFDMTLEKGTVEMCQKMAAEFSSLAIERINEEWIKWASRSVTPSKGIDVLFQTGWDKFWPILSELRKTPQDPVWHPEGNVLIHTLHCCDVAREIAERNNLGREDRAILVLAALCHDFGKPTTTSINEEGRIVAPKHDEAGIEPSIKFLTSIGVQEKDRQVICNLVQEHMAHISVEPTERTVKRLSVRLSPATLEMWSMVCEADHSGRPPLEKSNPTLQWIKIAEELQIKNSKPKPLVMGRHLVGLGVQPGPIMGKVLKETFSAQLDGHFSDVDSGVDFAKNLLLVNR